MFFEKNSSCSSNGSLSNIMFESAGNDINNKVNADASEKESCLSLFLSISNIYTVR